MTERKLHWVDRLEPVDPSLKTPYKLLASIAISLKRIADQGEPKAVHILVAPLYRGRRVNFYPVSDAELQQISLINTTSSACFAIASLLLGYVGSILLTASYTASAPISANRWMEQGVPICGTLCVIFFLLGLITAWRRSSTLKQIKLECKNSVEVAAV